MENSKREYRKKNEFFNIIGVCLIVFVIIFVMNQITWYTSDDYTYHFLYKHYLPSNQTQNINNISDLILSQYNHYLTWNGRFVGHTIVQIFMQFNKIYFNIFNSLAFVLLGLLINFIVTNYRKTFIRKNNLIFTYIFMWFFIPEFGNTVLWVSGSGNYLWTSLICCLFIFYFLRNSNKNTSIQLTVSAMFLSFIAGATNENTGPATIGICFLFFLYNYIERKKIILWQLLTILTGFLGTIVVLKSPGASKRSSIILNFNDIRESIVNLQSLYYGHLKILLFILVTCLLITITLNLLRKKDILFIVSFLLGSYASLYALSFSAEYPLRTLFGTTIFTIIVTIYLMDVVQKNIKEKFALLKIEKILVIVAVILFSVSYIYAFKIVFQTYNTVMDGIKKVENSKEEGKLDNIEIPIPTKTHNFYDSFTNTNSLHENPDAWFNRWMAKYYGVNSIVGKKQ